MHGPQGALAKFVSVLLLFSPVSSHATPVLNDPHFRISAVATGVQSPFDTVVGGGNGFAPGLYISTGLAGSSILRMNPDRSLSVFASGLGGADGITFGPGGAWGRDLYVAEIAGGVVSRIKADGTRTIVASGFSGPFGPAGIEFLPNGSGDFDMFVTSFSSNMLYRQRSPDAVASPFVVLGPDFTGLGGSAGFKNLARIPADFGLATGQLLVTSYDSNILDGRPTVNGAEFVDSAGTITPFLPPTPGLEFGDFSSATPGFGTDYYIASLGNFNILGDGGLLRIDNHGSVSQIVSGMDGGSATFDREGLLGGGMFLTDFNSGTIYQLRAVPEPTTWTILILGFAAIGCNLRSAKAAKVKRSSTRWLNGI